MYYIIKYLLRDLVLISPIVILWSCANFGTLRGGERDKKGPEVIGVIPAPQSLNFRGNRIDFYFDEFLKPGNYSNDIFISPITKISPEITIKNRRLRIQFKENLRDSTTYVISVGTGVTDFNEGNKMNESFTFAFSTGDQLDSMRISGSVINSWTGGCQKGINVFLFSAEEIQGNEIFEKKPVYVTETDENGFFEFEHLKNSTYKIYAVGDGDKSYSYNSTSEMLGLAENPFIDLTNTTQSVESIELFAFFPDDRAPAVRNLKWVNDHTMRLEFNEAIRPAYGDNSLQFVLSDTLGGNSQTLDIYRFKPENMSHVYLHTPNPRSNPVDLRILNIMDTLGNRADTIVRIDPGNFYREEKGKLFDAPIFQIDKNQILINSYFILPSSLNSSNIQLIDTNGTSFGMNIESSGFQIRAFLSDFPKVNMPYKLIIKPGIFISETTTDTLFEFPIIFPSVDDFGSISGKIIPDSTRPDAKWVVLIMDHTKGSSRANNAVANPANGDDGTAISSSSNIHAGKGRSSVSRSKGGSSGGYSKGEANGINYHRFIHSDSYQLYRIKPGEYKVKYIKDDDENGYFTPGNLDPYRMPEKTSVDSSIIKIRVRWEVEGYNLFPNIYPAPPEGVCSFKRD